MDTLVAFLLDRTGSMMPIKDDVIGSFNQFIRSQKDVPGGCRFILTLFDSQSIDTFDYSTIEKVPEFTGETYIPRASTPLYDAIGKTITAVDELDVHVDRILFVIQTDGYENASHHYNKDSIKRLIEEHQGEEYGWDFVFLGADIDAMAVGGSIGVPLANVVSYDSAMTSATMDSMSESVSSYRKGNDWKSDSSSTKTDDTSKATT
jgi:hypothetical protein